MVESNQRRFLRENSQATIQVRLIQYNFEGAEESQDLIPAKMINKSHNGLRIELDRHLDIGSKVRIKRALQADSGLDKAYYIHDGLVVWCKKNAEPSTCFGAGIKILRKVIQAEVLTSRFR